MAKRGFRFDKSFDRHLRFPNERTSLKPVGDKVREVSDDIRDAALRLINAEYARARSVTLAIREGSYDANAGRPGQGYLTAEAKEFALKSAADTTVAYMTGDTSGLKGRVAINRTGSATLEYGGEDPAARLGNTGQRVTHPAYAFLRRAMDSAS